MRAWGWAKEKFPAEDELVLPVKHHQQCCHYKPSIHPQLVGRCCIFMWWSFSPSNPALLQEPLKRSVFPSLTPPIHYTRVYSSERAHCARLELFCKIFISSFYPHHPLYGIYPSLSPLSHPCCSLAWKSVWNKGIVFPVLQGHLAETGPTEQNPALTSILSLNCQPAFIQTAPNPQGAPFGIASSLPCWLGPVALSHGTQDLWKIHPINL